MAISVRELGFAGVVDAVVAELNKLGYEASIINAKSPSKKFLVRDRTFTITMGDGVRFVVFRLNGKEVTRKLDSFAVIQELTAAVIEWITRYEQEREFHAQREDARKPYDAALRQLSGTFAGKFFVRDDYKKVCLVYSPFGLEITDLAKFPAIAAILVAAESQIEAINAKAREDVAKVVEESK